MSGKACARERAAGYSVAHGALPSPNLVARHSRPWWSSKLESSRFASFSYSTARGVTPGSPSEESLAFLEAQVTVLSSKGLCDAQLKEKVASLEAQLKTVSSTVSSLASTLGVAVVQSLSQMLPDAFA